MLEVEVLWCSGWKKWRSQALVMYNAVTDSLSYYSAEPHVYQWASDTIHVFSDVYKIWVGEQQLSVNQRDSGSCIEKSEEGGLISVYARCKEDRQHWQFWSKISDKNFNEFFSLLHFKLIFLVVKCGDSCNSSRLLASWIWDIQRKQWCSPARKAQAPWLELPLGGKNKSGIQWLSTVSARRSIRSDSSNAGSEVWKLYKCQVVSHVTVH